MEGLFSIIRAIFALSGALWIGEVVTVNVILVPVLLHYQDDMRKQFLVSVFPRIFKLASVLSITAVITGILMVYYSIHGDFRNLLSVSWGSSVLAGGSLGIALTVFHFFKSRILMKKIRLGVQGDTKQLSDVYSKLRIIPRVGLVIILTIFLLMLNVLRGWYI